MKKASLLEGWWQSVFLLSSGNPGKLSISGFNRSMSLWGDQVGGFDTEFLSGCNMTFRRKALKGIPAASFLQGYSLGEDLYLSWWASRSGRLVVDPGMKVRHWKVLTSRIDKRAHGKAVVVNNWYLLRARRSHPLASWAFLWSTVGLLGQTLLSACLKLLRGNIGAARASFFDVVWAYGRSKVAYLSGQIGWAAGFSDFGKYRPATTLGRMSLRMSLPDEVPTVSASQTRTRRRAIATG